MTAPKCQVCPAPAQWGFYTTPRCYAHRLAEQGGRRVKAKTLMLGSGVPDDARPGDVVVGNRGAAAMVVQPPSQFGGLCACLTLDYIGNIHDGMIRVHPCNKVYDFQ